MANIKLSKEDIEELNKLYLKGFSISYLSLKYQVHSSTIRRKLKNKTAPKKSLVCIYNDKTRTELESLLTRYFKDEEVLRNFKEELFTNFSVDYSPLETPVIIELEELKDEKQSI